MVAVDCRSEFRGYIWSGHCPFVYEGDIGALPQKVCSQSKKIRCTFKDKTDPGISSLSEARLRAE